MIIINWLIFSIITESVHLFYCVAFKVFSDLLANSSVLFSSSFFVVVLFVCLFCFLFVCFFLLGKLCVKCC